MGEKLLNQGHFWQILIHNKKLSIFEKKFLLDLGPRCLLCVQNGF